MSFWKCRKRKIYAVLLDDDGTDTGDEPGPSRKRKKDDCLAQLIDSVEIIKNDIDQIKTLTRDATTKLPLGLETALQEAFKCTICHHIPIRGPMIVAKCCKCIIGCEQCVHTWYSGQDILTKTCPLCRTERGFTETMRLNGLDQLLQAVRNALNVEQDGDPSDVEG